MLYDKSMTMTAPEVGRKVRAVTLTPTAQNVVVEITKVDGEVDGGWIVYGYRNHRGSRPRQTAYPRQYFVPRATCSATPGWIDNTGVTA